MSYRPSVIAALLALLATPASAGNVIDPYTLFPPAAPASIAYESIGTVTYLNYVEAGTSESVALPTGLVASDLLLAFVFSGPGTGATTATSGWTREDAGDGCNAGEAYCLTVFSASGSAAAPTFSIRDDRSITAVIARFSNGTGVDDIQCNYLPYGSPSTSHTTENVTPTETTGLIVHTVGIQYGANITFTTTPATNILTQNVFGGDNYGLAIGYTASSGTSAQGSVTYTTSAVQIDGTCSVAIH